MVTTYAFRRRVLCAEAKALSIPNYYKLTNKELRLAIVNQLTTIKRKELLENGNVREG